MNNLFKIETVKPPPQISATEYTPASLCQLQFVLNHSFRKSQRPPPLPSASPHRYIGTVHHNVIEAARQGEAENPPDKAALEERWETELSGIESQIKKNGDDVWLPLKERIDTLERTRKLCIDLAEQQRVQKKADKLSKSDERVTGRWDDIDRDPQSGQVTLTDFKSGQLLDQSGHVKQEYRNQMLIYAHLYFKRNKSWPKTLQLVDRMGNKTPIDWTPEQATHTFESADSLLDSLQNTIGDGGRLEEKRIRNLANLEKGPCSSCQYRPICPAYCEDLKNRGLVNLDDKKYPLVDITGRVTKVTPTQQGFRLVLACPDAERTILNLPTQAISFDIEKLSPGQQVMVFNVRPSRPVEENPEMLLLGAQRITRASL